MSKKLFVRTKRNYRGIYSTSKQMGALLPEFLKHINSVRTKSPDKVYTMWYRIVPKNYSVHTKPISFEKGVLTVEVASSTLYAILAAQEKFNLLNELQRKLPSYAIRDLIFKR